MPHESRGAQGASGPLRVIGEAHARPPTTPRSRVVAQLDRPSPAGPSQSMRPRDRWRKLSHYPISTSVTARCNVVRDRSDAPPRVPRPARALGRHGAVVLPVPGRAPAPAVAAAGHADRAALGAGRLLRHRQPDLERELVSPGRRTGSSRWPAREASTSASGRTRTSATSRGCGRARRSSSTSAGRTCSSTCSCTRSWSARTTPHLPLPAALAALLRAARRAGAAGPRSRRSTGAALAAAARAQPGAGDRHIEQRIGLRLGDDDRAACAPCSTAFFEGQLELRFRTLRPARAAVPPHLALAAAGRSPDGRLAASSSPPTTIAPCATSRAPALVPVVGDFAGPRALRAIAG